MLVDIFIKEVKLFTANIYYIFIAFNTDKRIQRKRFDL